MQEADVPDHFGSSIIAIRTVQYYRMPLVVEEQAGGYIAVVSHTCAKPRIQIDGDDHLWQTE